MKPKANPFLRTASLAVSIVLTAGSALAATYQWNGATSSDWTTPTNWATGTGLTAGPAPTGVSASHRLNVLNGNANKLLYTSTQGNTTYANTTDRGVVIGSGTSAKGELEITGGTFSTLGSAAADVIGNGSGATGTLTINGGTFIGTASTSPAPNIGTCLGIGGGPTSTLNMLAGTATLTNLSLNNTTGTINLNGGTLELNKITRTAGTNTINLNGGTLKARENNTGFISTGVSAITAVSSSTIDTAGFDVSINSAISGSGTINKNNAGKLTLTANNPYTGNLVINAGTLALAPTSASTFAGAASGAGALEIGGTSTVNLTGTNTHGGGTTVLSGASLSGEGSVSGALTFGGTSNFFFDPTTTGANQYFRAGSINASGGTVSIVPSTSASGSGIVVMEAAGGITGTIGTNFLGSSRLSLSFNLGNTQLLANYTPATLKWTGTNVTNPTWWDTGVTVNWDNGGSADNFFAGDNVLFDDTASIFTVDVQAALFPGNITFNHSSNNYTINGAAIGGSGSLTKNGTGTLTLNTANTYTGTTTINAGMIIAGNNAALGSNVSGTTVAADATLDINGKSLGTEVITISGVGDGSGAIINSGLEQINAIGRLVLAADASIGGSGTRWDIRNSTPTIDMGTGVGSPFTLTKSGSNYVGLVGVAVSNPGDIDVAEGTFSIQTGTTMGGSSANTITVRGGATLSSWQAANPTSWSLDLKSGSILRSESASASTQNIWTGPVTLEDAGTITVDAVGTMTISGAISGTGSAIDKTSAGVAFISGANSYTGTTTVTAGSLVLQNTTALGTTVAGTSVLSGGRVELDNLTITGENITIAGEGGNFFGPLQGRAGSSVWTGNVIVDANLTRIGTAAGATLEVSGVISSTADHIVVFRPNNDTSPVILSGNNTYTGPTWIVGGVVSASNLGSVAGGASNFGSPTSTANGTIRMSILNGTGTLRYTGTGETTNRVIDLFAANNGAFIDQSGTGLLKFTSDLTATGVGAKTLVLQGSTAGTGELAGAIVDNPTTGSTLLTTAFAAAANTITLNSVSGISTGASISGTGIAGGTTVTAVNAGTRVVTLSAATTGAGTAGDVITVTGVTNPTGLRKEGTGTWTASGTNTFTSSVIINGGVLRITNSSGLGTGVKSVTINATADKWLELDGSGGNITLPADFSFFTSGVNGAIRNTAGDNVINGNFTMTIGNGNTRIISDNAGSLTLAGNVTTNTGTRVLDLAGDSVANNVFSGVLDNTNTPGLAKSGIGKWTLTGTNTYTGATTINGGTLVLGSTGSIDASTALTVAAGAKLDTTAKSTHTLPAAVTIGLDGDAETSGLIDATGQALDIDAATVTFNVTGTLDAPSYVIAKYGSISGTAAFVSITPPSGYTVDYGTGPSGEIRLVQSGTDYDDWMDLYPSLTGSDKLPGADPDGDGLINQEEYAFGLAPNSGSSVNPITVQLNKTAGNFTYTRRKTSLTGLTYKVWTSENLTSWTQDTGATETSVVDSGDNQTVTILLSGTTPRTEAKLFVRVTAE